VQMDKASIIGDAIDYVRVLQKELEEIESEIDDLEQKCTGSVGDEAGSMEAATGENFSNPTSSNPGSGAEGEPGLEPTVVTIESCVDKVSGDSTPAPLPARLAQKILEVSNPIASLDHGCVWSFFSLRFLMVELFRWMW
jgi:hypothetical protein